MYYQKEAMQVVDLAQQMAKQRQHEEVDSSHLFYVLLKKARQEKIGLQTVDVKMDEFLGLLDEAFLGWYPTPSKYPEPSEAYLQAMRSAEKVSEVGRKSVTPTHLKAVTEQKGTQLSEWLSQHMKVPVIVQSLLATPTLDQISRDLTLLARDNKLAPVIGRGKKEGAGTYWSNCLNVERIASYYWVQRALAKLQLSNFWLRILLAGKCPTNLKMFD